MTPMHWEKPKSVLRAAPVLIVAVWAGEVVWKQRGGRSACCGGAGETSLKNEFRMRTKEKRFVSHEKREVMF